MHIRSNSRSSPRPLPGRGLPWLLTLAALAATAGCDARPELGQHQVERLLFPAVFQAAGSGHDERCAAGDAGVPQWLREGLESPRCTNQIRSALAFSDPAEVQSLLAAAAICDDPEAVARLLAQGADVNGTDACGHTALVVAASAGARRAAARLLRAGADRDKPGGEGRWRRTPLLAAAVRADAGMIQLLLDAGADPNAMTPGGRTVLMMAATAGDLSVVSQLVKHGADPCCTDEGGLDAARVARAHGALVVAALLEQLEASCTSNSCQDDPARAAEMAR